MTDETVLRDRLADLADDLPVVPVDPAVLWSAGVRRQRRRRAAYAGGGLAAALALVVGVAGGGQLVGAAEPGPVKGAADSALMLPDNFYSPSAWLDGTDDEGEIGPLTAVIPAERGSLAARAEGGLVGVSGQTGEYRFLDLKHIARIEYEPALSPDGRYLAYWTSPEFDSPEPDVTGWSVYDTVTGEESYQRAGTGLGIQPKVLVWAGHDLWVQYVVTDERTGSGETGTMQPPVIWSPDRVREPRNVPDPLFIHPDAIASGEALVWAERGGTVMLRPEGWSRTEGDWDAGSTPLTGPLVVAGLRLASLLDEDGSDDCCLDDYPVLVHLGNRDAEPMHTLPGAVRASEVVAWRSADELVVRQGDGLDRRYTAVDVLTGQQRLLVAADGMGVLPVVAGDAWQAPTYHAEEPDWPMNPRFIVLGGLAGGLALLAMVVLVWRRRDRR